MKKSLIPLALAALFPISSYAVSSDLIKELGPVSTIGFVSLFSLSSLESTNYFSSNTKDDAASFIATNGDITGSSFESAYSDFTQKNPNIQISKNDFALSILSQDVEQI